MDELEMAKYVCYSILIFLSEGIFASKRLLKGEFGNTIFLAVYGRIRRRIFISASFVILKI